MTSCELVAEILVKRLAVIGQRDGRLALLVNRHVVVVAVGGTSRK
jgi:hypothetical protein